MWEITYRCNLRCVHCYRVEDRRKKELTTAQGKSLLQQMADEGTLNLAFTGGEPLLRKDFFELARYARSMNFLLRIFTNGTLITPETADRIRDLLPDSVHISLYAVEVVQPPLDTRDEKQQPSSQRGSGKLPGQKVPGAPLFEQVSRVKGSYAKVMRAIDLLKERNVRVILKTPLMNLNYQQFRRIKKIAREKRCEIVFDTKITPRNDGSPGPLCYQMEERLLESLLRKVEGARPDIPSVKEALPDLAPCNAGFNLVAISPYGQVFPCIQLRKEAGNVKRGTFRHIWRNSPVMTEVRNAKISDSVECSSCKYAQWCVRCPGLAYVETDSMYAASPIACKEARIRKKIAQSAMRRSRR